MAPRFSGGPRVPDIVACAGCGRMLEARRYGGDPRDDTPASRVTVRVAPTYPHFSVACTCGHYTVYVPSEEWRRLFTSKPPARPDGDGADVSSGDRKHDALGEMTGSSE